MRSLVALALVSVAVAATAEPKAAPTPAPTPVAEKLVCKRPSKIGSMIPGPKECRTRAEWSQMAQNGRATGQDIMDRRVSSSAMDQ